jgi:hypothetical protein
MRGMQAQPTGSAWLRHRKGDGPAMRSARGALAGLAATAAFAMVDVGGVGRLGSVFHLTREGDVKKRCAFVIAGLAVAGAVVAGTPASARPIDKGHFHDVFTGDVYDCDGIPAQDSGDVSGNFVFNQRGSSPFPYDRESLHGTVMTTNLETGGTFSNVFTSNSRDHSIVDNGDGTITITVFASGGSRRYDANGELVLRETGQIRFAFDIDYNGTPGDPSDDVEVPDSFRIVRPFTGHSDVSGGDFCAALAEFTS